MKRYFKVIAIFMIVLLIMGSLTTLFDIGASDSGITINRSEDDEEKIPEEPIVPEEPDAPKCEHQDADDDFLCDVCGEFCDDGSECQHRDSDDDSYCDYCGVTYYDGEECSHRDSTDDGYCDKCGETFSDGAEPFGGTTLINLDFSESVNFRYDNKSDISGVVPSIKYGAISTEDGYFKAYTEDADDGHLQNSSNASYISLSFVENDANVELSNIDYLTIDFDLWTDSEFINPFALSFFGFDENGDRIYSNSNSLKVWIGSSGSYLTVNSKENDLYFTELYEPVHITYLIKIDHSDVTKSVVKVYLNGEFLTADTTPFVNFTSLHHLRIIYTEKTVSSGNSLCLDNFTVNSFGNGDGSYTGKIYLAYLSDLINLSECPDSVLFPRQN